MLEEYPWTLASAPPEHLTAGSIADAEPTSSPAAADRCIAVVGNAAPPMTAQADNPSPTPCGIYCTLQLQSGGRCVEDVLLSNGKGSMKPELLELLLTREMPFGKYKGRIIADLPGAYLAWFARQGFPSGELGQLLALMHELDHNNLVGLLEPLRRRGKGASD